MTAHENHYDKELVVLFSFLSLRFSLIESFAFFLVSRLPLSFFPLSPILIHPHLTMVVCELSHHSTKAQVLGALWDPGEISGDNSLLV